MAQTSPPPPDAALTWRPWTVDDADALHRNMVRIHAVETLDHVPGPESFRALAVQDGFDPASGSLIGVDDQGEVQAEVGVWNHVTDEGARVFFWVEAGPGYEALRPFLFSWAEARARETLSTVPDGLERVMRTGIEENRTGLREAAEAAGFVAGRSFAVMRRDLGDLPALPPLPDGIRVEPWSEAIDDEMRLASNEAFADHWGSLPSSPQMWAGMVGDSDTFRRDASFAALDGDRVASFCTVEFDPEDVPTRGIVEYYIHRVGTRRAYRGLGLASHVIIRALQVAAAAGADTVALEVDEMSHTNATEVYRRLGFVVAERSIHYLKRY